MNKQHMWKFLKCNPRPLLPMGLRLGNELESMATPVLSGCLGGKRHKFQKSKGPKGKTNRQWVGNCPINLYGEGSSRVQND